MSKIDLLTELFSTLRLRSDIYFRAELVGQYAIEIPAEQRLIRFHLVRHGSCYVKLTTGGDAVRLFEGDMVIIPHGAAQILADTPDRPPVSLGDILESGAIDDTGLLRAGMGAGKTQLLCGYCRFDEKIDHPVISGLPPMIVLKAADLGHEPWISAALRLISLEADLNEQGMHGILARLLEVIFVQTVRLLDAHADGQRIGYMAALADKNLSKALAAIHKHPEQPWTIAKLAKTAGMSRARFADKFNAMVGEPPIAYLTTWRLMLARRLLRETGLTIDNVARRCGYASVPSFSRRFMTAFDVGPGAFRRER